MSIKEKIKYHKENKKYCLIMRQVAKGAIEKSGGYIVDYSKDFVLLQVSDDFEIDGFAIFPIKAIVEISYNNNDKYYDKIMNLEGVDSRVKSNHKIDLTNWETIIKFDDRYTNTLSKYLRVRKSR